MSTAEEYRYSTFAELLGQSPLINPIEADQMLMGEIEDTLSWINEMPDAENIQNVRRALKRAEFRLAPMRKDRRTSALEFEEL